MSEQPAKTASDQPITITSWARTVIQPILLTANTLALLAVILIFLQRMDGERPWVALLIPCIFIAAESYSTTIWLASPSRRQLNHTKYRAAELLTLLIMVRLFTWAVYGNWPNLGQWPDYLANPLLLFADIYFIGAVVVAYAAWYRTLAISRVFTRLAPDTAEQAYYSLPRHERLEANQPLPTNREALQQNFMQQFLGGAIVLLVCISLTSIELDTVWTLESVLSGGIARLGLPPGMLASLLIYFLTGFLLLSQGRLAMMEARWLADDAVRSPGIGRNWYQRTLFILLAIGLAAAFLPLGSTFTFGRILAYGLYGMMLAISSLFYFFSILFLSLLSFLFPRQQVAEPEPFTPPTPPPLLPQQPETAQPDMLMHMILTSAFWAVVIVVSVLAFAFFLRERGVKVNTAVLRHLWRGFVLWWRSLWQGLRSELNEVREAIQTRLQRSPRNPEVRPPWRYVRLNSLSPREKVFYFYLAMVKRAGNEGVPREQSETPTEFAGDLKASWPDADAEIDGLTDAFMLARYGRQPIAEKDIPPIKAKWQRMKANIRRRRKTPPPPVETKENAPPSSGPPSSGPPSNGPR